MATERRRGVESSATRTALVEAAERLIREEGYPAVTARNLATKLNLTRQIVHYYFRSMDDVLVEVVRNNAKRLRDWLAEVQRSPEPLRALQILTRDPDQALLTIELNALAARNRAVRTEVVRSANELRALQTQILANHVEERGIAAKLPPVVATILLTSLAQVLALEASIDIHSGHKETLAFVDACLSAFAKGIDVPFPISAAPAARSPVASKRVTKRARAGSSTRGRTKR